MTTQDIYNIAFAICLLVLTFRVSRWIRRVKRCTIAIACLILKWEDKFGDLHDYEDVKQRFLPDNP